MSRQRFLAGNLLGCAAVLLAALLVFTPGCPPAADDGDTNDPNVTDSNSTDPNDSNSTDPNDSNSTDPNDSNSTDPNDSNSTDPNDSNSPGGNDVGGDTTTPPASITLQQIVQTGNSVPGQTGATFTTFGSPIIDGDGRVAFWALYTGGSGHGGLYVVANGVISRVVDDDPNVTGNVPGGVAAERFGSYVASGDYDPLKESITWGATGRLLFTTRISGAAGRTGLFRWRASDSNLIVVADSTMIAAAFGVSVSGFLPTFSNHGVSDAGIVLFEISYIRVSDTGFTSGTAVCTSNGQVVTLLAKEGGAVPTTTTGTFTTFDDLTTLNPAGQMLFQGRYTNAAGNAGVYVSVNGAAAARVVDNRPTLSLPGLTAGARIGTDGQFYSAMAIGVNNHIAIQTPITVSGATHDAVILWNWTASQWKELVVAGGTAATRLISGVTDGGAVVVLAGGIPYVVDRSTYANIAATLPTGLTDASPAWATTGGAVNNFGHAVVRYTRADGTPGLGFWNNQELLILADAKASLPAANVTELVANSVPETDRPGRSGILNDHDQAVFKVTLAGGNQAIYVGRAQ